MGKDLEKVSELHEKMMPYSGQKILIVLRGAPDADSISAALAHQAILNSWGIGSTILHVEAVSHQENLALLKLLGIELVQYRPGFPFGDYKAISLVDSQRPDIALAEALKNMPVASIVDHHDQFGVLKADFIDIRKNVGSTATIYAEYLQRLDLLATLEEESMPIATALMHGIRVDTKDLIVAQESDYLAMAYLRRYADVELLGKISQQNLSPTTMDIIFQAYQRKDIYGSFLLAAAGVVRREDRDAIPQAADFLLKRAGIDTVMVYGIVGEYIDCSLRTNSDVIQPEKFIQDTFPDVVMGEYGGRFDQGGFRLPLGIFKALASGDDKEALSMVVDRYIKKQIATKFGFEKG
ncbi:MAG: DHH family phosphoesterase [bacterium]|nr:DHH family phosphoesterase [bacterium]